MPKFLSSFHCEGLIFNNLTREKTVHVRVGDMCLTYSWQKNRQMGDIPPLATETASSMIRRKLLEVTKSSHEANPVVDLAKVKAVKEQQKEESALWSKEMTQK